MITLHNITLRRGAKVLLQGASVTLNPGEKAAVVGRNGAGKSSLFALLTGTLHEDGGDWSIPKHWRLAQVAQDIPDTEQNATDFVVDGDTRLRAARLEVAAAEAAGDYERMGHAYTELHDAGAHDAPARAQALILGLGFQVDQLQRPVNSFSGGWRMRLQLARALMCPSDLLLLDEPTNHLDLDALIWLEGWLQRYPGTLLVISHDREFLDAATRVTLHIDQARITRYGGNYSRFEAMRAERLLQQQAAYQRQQAQRAHLQAFIDRFKAKATKAKQAQSRIKALARMQEVLPVLSESEFQFSFAPPPQLPNPMLTFSGVAAGYPATGDANDPTVVLRNIQRSVLAGQRIGILGANGQGKSTLVKTIAGQLAPLTGRLTEGKGLRLGYFAQQELDVLRPDETPFQHIARTTAQLSASNLGADSPREQDLRNFLGRFQFSGDMMQQPVGQFSGGEKARLVLALIVWQRPNLLLLDEPTNHLDLTTREALALALNEFEGTVLLVSHDRALLRSVCDEFWLVARGTVAPFDGDLDDYQRYLMEESKRAAESLRQAQSSSAPPKPAPPAPATANSPKAPSASTVRRKLQELEARMSALNAERSQLEQQLTQTTHPQELARIGTRLQALQPELDEVEALWLHWAEQA